MDIQKSKPIAIAVASLKGGVGKTTVSAGIALELSEICRAALPSAQSDTAAIDCDFASGGLDIALGCENMITVPITDHMLGEAGLDEVINKTPFDRLVFLSSPMERRAFFGAETEEALKQKADLLLSELKKRFTYVVLDLPAGGGELFDALCASEQLDLIIVVATDSINSIRSAEKTAYELARISKSQVKLVVNGYDLVAHRNNARGIVELMALTGLPIIGVVPYSPNAEKALSEGKPLTCFKDDPAGKAMHSIAHRIVGERVPLLDGIVKRRRRKRFY